jgi:hypothetical protein
LVVLQRVEVWVVEVVLMLGGSLREHGRYAHGHSNTINDNRRQHAISESQEDNLSTVPPHIVGVLIRELRLIRLDH